MGILDDDVARVREATDIVALVSEHVALKRVGRRFQGLCPFHQEKTPSFSVSPERGVFHCLAGETRVVTWDGIREIRDLAGGTHKVLTTHGQWIDAPFYAYGKQRLHRITATRNRQRKGLYATDGHRWFIRTGGGGRKRSERTTVELKAGDLLAWTFPEDAATKKWIRRGWVVRSVEETERFEEVFCAEVPETHAFVLEDNILTGNCFGCQKSGDAITFVREVENLDFVGAVERLAARANITLRYDDANFSQERKRQQRLHETVQAAIDFYHRRLLEADDAGNARRYLRSRGFDGDAARRFFVGYSPDGYDALSVHLQQSKFARQDIVDAGLAFVNRANKLQDAFRGRLMFPIWDMRGDPVGFGGRTLTDQGPKYKNTAETPIYHKSRLLYGLNFAKGEIVAQGEVVICEGYTDVMAFALAGVPIAVATCGTALADEHFLTLKNLARKVTLAYDADAAGQAAAERCYQWEQRFEVQFQVADLPAGRDPADVWKDDPQQLVAAVKGATPFMEFRLDRLLRSADIGSLEGRAHVAEQAATLIAEHPNDLVRDQYVMKLASRLDIDPDRLRDTVTRARNRPHVRSQGQPAPAERVAAARPVDRRELDALLWAVHMPELMSGRLDLTLFADPVARSAFEALTDWPWHECLERAEPEVAALLQRLAVEELDDTLPAEEFATRVVVNLVEASSQRLLASMLRREDPRSADIKALLDALTNARSAEHWDAAAIAAEQLVTWITDDGDA